MHVLCFFLVCVLHCFADFDGLATCLVGHFLRIGDLVEFEAGQNSTRLHGISLVKFVLEWQDLTNPSVRREGMALDTLDCSVR